ncbi:MAG TPA: hypothetical protein DCY06_13120 [Bacteroidetes bacterium]|nr:hypothetical protein [Bacteroidota bacterium]
MIVKMHTFLMRVSFHYKFSYKIKKGRNLITSPSEAVAAQRKRHKRRAPYNETTPSVHFFPFVKLPHFRWKRDESRPKLSRYVDARYTFYFKK